VFNRVTEIRVNICFSSCGLSVNLYLEAIVNSMEDKILGVDEDLSKSHG
jgi:hypothetical protein